MRYSWVILVAGCCVLTFSGCSRWSKADGAKDKDKEKPEEGIPVEVTSLSRGEIESVYQVSTDLEAEEEVKVFSRTSNRVIELLVEEGDTIEKGQLLLRLEDDIQKTQLGKAEVKLLKAQQEFNRQKSLFEQKLISEQSFNDAHFELKQLQLAFDDAQRELHYTEVRAPIRGTIARRLINLGDHVTVNQHLFDIIDFDSIVARVYVPEKNLSQLRIGQPARVVATALGSDKIYAGYVKRIAPIVIAKTGMVKVTVGFNDVGQLRPGMYANVEIVLAKHNDALLISNRALVYDKSNDQTYVFRLLPNRRVERVLVDAELRDKFHVAPTSGFKEGDAIVTAGQTGLKDGALVRLPGDPKPGDDKPEKTQTAGKAAPPG